MGEGSGDPKLPEERPLDEVFATRSHVRILPVLSLLGDDVNLTGRDVARNAQISHARAVEVLGSLVSLGIVTCYREASWAIYELNRDNHLDPVVRWLFERERDLTPV
jgi:hypothetical protein